MHPRTADQIAEWPSRPLTGGLDGLRGLADESFTGAVAGGDSWLFVLNGRLVGAGRSLDAVAEASATVHEAPDPALPLLFAMLAGDGEDRGQYYTGRTPLSEVHATLREGGFTGYLELSENVLSGDYYVAYYGGEPTYAAFVGGSDRLLTGEAAFERACDEVGLYTVTATPLDVRDVPGPAPGEAPASTVPVADAAEPEPDTLADSDDGSGPDADTDGAGDVLDSDPPEADPADGALDDPVAGPSETPGAPDSDGTVAAVSDGGVESKTAAGGLEDGRFAARDAVDAPDVPDASTGPDGEHPGVPEPPTIPEGLPPAVCDVAETSDDGTAEVSMDDRDIGPDVTEAGSREAESLRRRAAALERRLEAAEREAVRVANERDSVGAERDRLRDEVDRLEGRIAALETGGGDGNHPDGEGGERREMAPSAALAETDLFVRYRSRGDTTLADAPTAGDREAVGENLGLEHHTRFDAETVAVDGVPFESFLDGTLGHAFVDWFLRDLLFEVRETGRGDALRALCDVIPAVDRAQFHGAVEVEEGSVEFDVVCRDRLGNPLVCVDLHDSREPATDGEMEALLTSANEVAAVHDRFAGAFLVASSFFDPTALELADEVTTSGGLLGGRKRASYVRATRKRGYHLCLVEARDRRFHVTVPEL